MGKMYVVVAEATTNLITNPSFELATTGYTAVAGGTLARSTEKQRRGLYSGKYTPTSNTGDGIYDSRTLAANTPHTFSVDVWGVDGVPYKIYAYDVTAAAVLGTATSWTGKGSWKRVTVTFTTASDTSIRLYLVKDNSASTTAFYSDGWQCEQKAYATTYCDGDRDGCVWSAGKHTSPSSRSAQYYGGGQVVDLSTYGFYVEEIPGTGMPPISNISNAPALSDGGIFQRGLAKARVFTLVGMVPSSTLSSLHSQRQSFIDRLKMDRLASQQPIQFRYTGGDKPLAIDCYYDAGLELGRLLWVNERAAARFVAYDPYWRAVIGTGGADSGDNGSTSGAASTGDTAVSAGVQTSVTNANRILKRSPAGIWAAMSAGVSGGEVHTIAIAPDGKVAIGGTFTSAGGVANTDMIALYDPVTDTFSAFGTGGPGGSIVYDLAYGPDGALWAVGSFASMGGVANTSRIAKFASSAWASVSSSFTGTDLRCITIGPDGTVYVAGQYSNIAGVAMANVGKRSTAGTWSALDTGLGTANVNIVFDLEFGADRTTLYGGGDFTSPSSYLAQFTGGAWSAVVSGTTDARVRLIKLDAAGNLIIGGNFGTIGGVVASKIARFNGNSMFPLGSGVSGEVYDAAFFSGGKMIAVGTFVTAGGLTLLSAMAYWNGSAWSYVDVQLPSAPNVNAVELTNDETMYISFTSSGTAIAGAIS